MDEYSQTYVVRWADIDANGHMSSTAYIDASADLRYRFFSEHGFPPEAFQSLGVGAVYMRIEGQFFREVKMGEVLTINYQLAGLSPQGGRWKVQHDLFKSNGKKAATIILDGVVLDLNTRKPVLPPPALMALFLQIPRRPDFAELSESRWNR